jgi:alpha-aminoadipate carrier protein LysW
MNVQDKSPEAQAGNQAPSESLDKIEEVCPACGSALDLPEDLVLGEILYCDHCGVELEAVGLDPLRIDLFEEEEK